MTTPLNDDLVKYMRELANSKMDVVLSNSFYEPTEYRETVVSATLHNGANEIERLRAELTEANALIERLRDGLEPFAEFAETLNEWHTKSGFGEQKAFPQDRPVMFRTRPEGDDAFIRRELWPTHFRTAARLIAEIDAQNKTTPDAGSAEG